MKKILFLFLIYATSIESSEQGCVISFFSKERSPCSSTTEESKKRSVAPICIKEKTDKTILDRKKIEEKLHSILIDVKEYKKKNLEKTKRLEEELNLMKKKFQQYKMRKTKELKRVKKQLYSTTKKLKSKITKSKKKKLVKVHKKVKKYIKRKTQKKKIVIAKVIKRDIPIPVTETSTKVIHKVIHKMEPLPIVMYDTPWIEIVVDKNINIYDLALKYYGDKQEYKKIYIANQNVISSDLKIYNGMTLVIPMTENFREQGIVLNQ